MRRGTARPRTARRMRNGSSCSIPMNSRRATRSKAHGQRLTCGLRTRIWAASQLTAGSPNQGGSQAPSGGACDGGGSARCRTTSRVCRPAGMGVADASGGSAFACAGSGTGIVPTAHSRAQCARWLTSTWSTSSAARISAGSRAAASRALAGSPHHAAITACDGEAIAACATGRHSCANQATNASVQVIRKRIKAGRIGRIVVRDSRPLSSPTCSCRARTARAARSS